MATKLTKLEDVKLGQRFYFANKSGMPAYSGKLYELTRTNGKIFECDGVTSKDRKVYGLSHNKTVIIVAY